MARVGRPPKVPEADMPELVQKFADYIDGAAIPIIAEFAYKNDVPRTWLYERPEFLTLLKKCIDKKEAALEIGALKGELNPTMSIFSLKQMGWKDKQEIDSNNINHNTTQDITQLSTDERRARIDELNRRRGNGTHSPS
jgi:hypothetical protein